MSAEIRRDILEIEKLRQAIETELARSPELSLAGINGLFASVPKVIR